MDNYGGCMQLFCLSFAGGTAAFYNQIEPYISREIEIIKLEYAGHGIRNKENFYTDFDELAEDMYSEIKKLLHPDKEYALFGYSMGSISLVEILKRIIKRAEIKLPTRVFLAAHEPVTKKELSNYSSVELDEYVKERTISFGGIPERLIHNNSFWRIYLPIYRNDYSIIGKYDFKRLDLRTDIPAIVLYSPSDTKIEDIRLWKKYFCGDVEYLEFNGTHFFINEYCEEICAMINNRLLED